MSYRQMPFVSQQIGRSSQDLASLSIKSKSLYFFRLKLDQGGFDNGGARWDPRKPLYCVSDGLQPLAFTQAPSKYAAAVQLKVDPSWLKYQDVFIPVTKKGNMFHVKNMEGRTIGFANTYDLAMCKWSKYRSGVRVFQKVQEINSGNYLADENT